MNGCFLFHWLAPSGSVSSVGWLFDKKGRVVFGAGESGHSLEQMMDSAIEAGAEDIEDYDDLVEVNESVSNHNNIALIFI